MKPLRSTPLRGDGLAIAHAVVGWLLAALLVVIATALGYPNEVYGARALLVLAVFLPIANVYFRWPAALSASAAGLVFTATAAALDVLVAVGGERPLTAHPGGELALAFVFAASWVMGTARRVSGRRQEERA